MCGIVGLVNTGSHRLLEKMTASLHHRGPNDRGVYGSTLREGGFIGLGATRLSILDLSAQGHMPMRSANGRYVIVYNGECYNHLELRKRYLPGHLFRSHSDTETVVELFGRYGSETVKLLNGMFAFAIWDELTHELFIARDHFGIKPLYYCAKGAQLQIASEVKALLLDPEFDRTLDFNSLKQFFTFLWVPEPETIFKSVRKLPAGHFGTWAKGALRLEKYWDLSFPDPEQTTYTNEADTVFEVRERFMASCKKQLLSDVPIGAFLSAGIDSSSIVASVAQQTSQPINTFTISFPKDQRKGQITLDDPSVAANTAREFGCRHSQITVDPDVTALLPKLIYHMDEPVSDPALIAAYLVCQSAKSTATVLLAGVGGDEIFAGYRKYRAHGLATAYRKFVPGPLRSHVIEPALRSLPSLRNTAMMGHMRLAKKMARSASLPAKDRFVQDSVYFDDEALLAVCSPELRAHMNGVDPRQGHLALFDRVQDADFVHQMLYVDSKAFMPSLNLLYNDKMSMAASVETRVPFLDWEFAEWVAQNVPPELKLHGGTTKYVFRQAMRPLLSDRLLQQRKAGFGVPIDRWIAHDLSEMFDDVLSESALNKHRLFHPGEVQKMREDHANGKDNSMQLWALLTFNLWLETFGGAA